MNHLPIEFVPKISLKIILQDIKKDRTKYPTPFSPNFLALLYYRLDYYFNHINKKWWNFPIHLIVKIIRKIIFVYNHIEISASYPHLYIEGGCLLNHHSSVISARIGENSRIFSFTTIGGADKRHPITKSKYPIIGNNVMIGTGAKIIGPVTIGHHTKIGANATITKDIPDNATVIGINQLLTKKEKPLK